MYDYDEMSDGPEPYDVNEQGQTVPVEVTVSWSNSEVIKQVVAVIAKQIKADIEKDVKQAIATELDIQVNSILSDVLNQEVQPTDQWGEPMGASGSIRDLLMRDAEGWLNEKVDDNGNSSTRYGKSQSRAQYLFNSLFKGRDSKLAKVVKEVIASDIGDIQKMVETAVKNQIREQLK